MKIVSFMGSFQTDLELTKKELKRIMKLYNIPFVFIGGVARNKYASPRMTSDIDILVSTKDKNKLKKIPIGYLKCLSKDSLKKFKLHEPKAEIEIIFSGEKAGNNLGIEYPEPKTIDSGDNVMTLESLIKFKLCSGIYGKRYKDFGDVQDLIKERKLKKNFANRFRNDLKIKYEELWEETINNKNFEQV